MLRRYRFLCRNWSSHDMEPPRGATLDQPLGTDHGSLVDRKSASKFMAHSMRVGRHATYIVYGFAVSGFVGLGIYLIMAAPQLRSPLRDPYRLTHDQNLPVLTEVQAAFLRGDPESTAADTIKETENSIATEKAKGSRPPVAGMKSLFTTGVSKNGLPPGALEGEEAPPLEEQSYTDRLKLSGTVRYKV